MLKIIHIFLTIFTQISVHAAEEVPSFRIVAPQNLCKHNDTKTVQLQPEGVTITFQPKDGLKLSYKFKIFFKVIAPTGLSQRETLLVWKAVRAVEQRLNSQERLQIMKNNMLLIRKAEVVAGVSYIFHVVGVTDAGETSREQVFTIDYAEGVLQNSNVPQGINLLVIGSEEIVANMEYSVTAKVSFCKPKNDYYLEWRIADLDEKYQIIENTISNTLIVPPNALSANRKTAIEALVRESASSKILAKDVLWVDVLNKGFQVIVIPTAARIGEGTFLTFRLFIRNYDRVQQLEIKWWLEDAATSHALLTKTNDQTYLKAFFEKAGSFQVIAQVTINDIATKVKADIEVSNSVFISYEYQNVPNLNPSSYEEFKFSVLVLNMVPNCEASWLSAQEEGFKLISSGLLEKEHYGYTKVANLEKHYLEEIIDFSNSTVSREITLDIPTTYGKADIVWSGFEGDAMYKFRLDVTCPKPFSESTQLKNEEDEPWLKVVTSYFTIDLHTNAPPQAAAVLIDPLQGVALKTIFNINCQEANDLLLDTPISYELFVQIEKFELSLGKYFQYKTWDTVLPVSPLPLQIKVVICDIRQACSIVQNDTLLPLAHEEFADPDYNAYEERVSGLLMRTDFQNALNSIIMATVSWKNSGFRYYEKWLNFVEKSLSREIDKLLEQAENKIYISPDAKLTFVVKCKEILDYTQQMHKKMLEKLLEILENLTEYAGAKDESQQRGRFKRSRRIKRIVNHSHELYAKTQLSLLEDLLKSEEYSSQAMDNFVQRIKNLGKKMCLNGNKNSQRIRSSLASLEVRYIESDFLQQRTTLITENVFDKLTLQFKNINTSSFPTDTQYCLVIKSYNFPDNSLIEYNIYKVSNNQLLQEMKMSDNGKAAYKVQLDIYTRERQHNKCLMKSSIATAWSTEHCRSHITQTFLRCLCSQTGFLKTAHVLTQATTEKTIMNHEIVSTASTKAFETVTATAAATSSSGVSTSTKPQTNNELQASSLPTTRSKNSPVKKASPLTYIIPLIFVLVLLLLGSIFLLHRRRSHMADKGATRLPPSTTNLPFRKRASGIRYANIYDDHLLNGNF